MREIQEALLMGKNARKLLRAIAGMLVEDGVLRCSGKEDAAVYELSVGQVCADGTCFGLFEDCTWKCQRKGCLMHLFHV